MKPGLNRFATIPAILLCLGLTAGAMCSRASGQDSSRINPDLKSRIWSARWITARGAEPFDFGVYHFRRNFELASVPASFVIHVTGDNRYQLYVNGERVVWGPARGDLNHWRYETVDIAKRLKPGRNTLAAVVWNFGQYAPESQVTWRTGFLLQGDEQAEHVVDTGGAWKAKRNDAYQPVYFSSGQLRGYYVAGPGERIDGARYPWGWELADFDDSGWENAVEATGDGRSRAAPRDGRDGPNRWMLIPRDIPLMEETPERIASVRKFEGATPPAGFPASPRAFQIPADTRATLILDQSRLTTAYPELIVSGGRGSEISLGYAESMFLNGTDGNDKGNRNDVENKYFRGYYDTFIADGGTNRLFRPLWWRTYRFLELKIETRGEPLTIEDLRGVYTGYPFERKSRFDARDDLLTRILDVGWHTARLCAHETYMDCPYYEQLQYVGDTRIQALVSFYNSGDARLARNAISQINDSRTAEGATMSRAPTRQQQYIPPFSLWWIGMVHDYWMYADDPEFIKQMMPGVRAVLTFFTDRQQSNGSLGKMPWWNYIDWTKEWEGGVPPRDARGSSAPQDLQLILALDWAAEMEESFGSRWQASDYRQQASKLRSTVKALYWDAGRRLFADTPEKKNYSQHANALAALAEVVTGDEARALVNRIIADRAIVQCSYYFRHYLHSAVNKVGEGDRYLDLLSEWKGMLDRGLTTFAERYEPTRSDCHAWSSSPNFELFRTVLGIESAAPGFSKVLIKPFPGSLRQITGAIPHPRGEIAVSLKVDTGKLNAEVSLPDGVTGEFVWNGRKQDLKPGKNTLTY